MMKHRSSSRHDGNDGDRDDDGDMGVLAQQQQQSRPPNSTINITAITATTSFAVAAVASSSSTSSPTLSSSPPQHHHPHRHRCRRILLHLRRSWRAAAAPKAPRRPLRFLPRGLILLLIVTFVLVLMATIVLHPLSSSTTGRSADDAVVVSVRIDDRHHGFDPQTGRRDTTRNSACRNVLPYLQSDSDGDDAVVPRLMLSLEHRTCRDSSLGNKLSMYYAAKIISDLASSTSSSGGGGGGGAEHGDNDNDNNNFEFRCPTIEQIPPFSWFVGGIHGVGGSSKSSSSVIAALQTNHRGVLGRGGGGGAINEQGGIQRIVNNNDDNDGSVAGAVTQQRNNDSSKRRNAVEHFCRWCDTHTAASCPTPPVVGKEGGGNAAGGGGGGRGGLDLAADWIQRDLRAVADAVDDLVAMVGTGTGKRRRSVEKEEESQESTAPALADAAVHVRCGDAVKPGGHSSYGLLPHRFYSDALLDAIERIRGRHSDVEAGRGGGNDDRHRTDKDGGGDNAIIRTVSIVTQPFDSDRLRPLDRPYGERCRRVVLDLARYLRDVLGSESSGGGGTDQEDRISSSLSSSSGVTVMVHNGPHETSRTAYARLVRVKVATICGPSTFCAFPTVASRGMGYIFYPSSPTSSDTPSADVADGGRIAEGIVNPWVKPVSERHPDRVTLRDAPRLKPDEAAVMSDDELLQWLRTS